jgi:hypothetical protein
MNEADKLQSNLTEEEQCRNKRSGDILLFKNQAKAPTEGEYQAEFASNDQVAGSIYKVNQGQVSVSGFRHPCSYKHST